MHARFKYPNNGRRGVVFQSRDERVRAVACDEEGVVGGGEGEDGGEGVGGGGGGVGEVVDARDAGGGGQVGVCGLGRFGFLVSRGFCAGVCCWGLFSGLWRRMAG